MKLALQKRFKNHPRENQNFSTDAEGNAIRDIKTPPPTPTQPREKHSYRASYRISDVWPVNTNRK